MKDYFLADTAVASCGRQVIDSEQNESISLSDMNTLTSIIVLDITLPNSEICVGFQMKGNTL